MSKIKKVAVFMTEDPKVEDNTHVICHITNKPCEQDKRLCSTTCYLTQKNTLTAAVYTLESKGEELSSDDIFKIAKGELFGEDGGIYSVPVPESRKILDCNIWGQGYKYASQNKKAEEQTLQWVSVYHRLPETGLFVFMKAEGGFMFIGTVSQIDGKIHEEGKPNPYTLSNDIYWLEEKAQPEQKGEVKEQT